MNTINKEVHILKEDRYDRRVRILALIVSLLFHLILLLLWGLFNDPDASARKLQEQLAKVKAQQDKRLVFELIETPDDIEQQEPDQESDLVSDKSIRAADRAKGDLEVGDPYSEGVIDSRAFAEERKQMPAEVAESNPVENAAKDMDHLNDDKSENSDDIGESLLADQSEAISKLKNRENSEEQLLSLEQKSRLKDILFDNVKTRAIEEGGMAFNTYQWDYAPYMLALKRRIGENLNLPYAFSHMGMIGGDVLIQFVVSPSGELTLNKIISTNAHESLQQASIVAIDKAFPFLPLPKDFPEDRLEVTAKFRYIINK